MRILCLRMSALGDVVLTTGVIAHLRRSFPDAEIHGLTDQALLPLQPFLRGLDRLHGIDRKKPWSHTQKVVEALPRFDAVIDWHDSLRSRAIRKVLNCQKTGILRKQSLRRRWFVATKMGRLHLQQHIVEKYLQAAQQVLPVPESSKESLRPQLEVPSLSAAQRDRWKLDNSYLVVHPYASQNNKIWPGFGALVNQLRGEGQRVLVIGRSTSPLGPHADNLTNRTTLPETLTLLQSARGLVTTDSGPMHLGLACNTPTLGLFGPTTREFGFFPEFAGARALEVNGLDCRPCHVHGGSQCPQGHFRCMKGLEAPDVRKALSALLQQK